MSATVHTYADVAQCKRYGFEPAKLNAALPAASVILQESYAHKAPAGRAAPPLNMALPATLGYFANTKEEPDPMGDNLMRYALKLMLSCTCLVSPQALAGAILNTETREFHVDPPAMGNSRMLADGKLLRVEINSLTSGEDGLIIYRGDRNELIVADSEMLQYYVIDEKGMNQMAAQIRDTMKQADEMLKSMPPEERAEAEQMMREQMPGLQPVSEAPSTIQNTGRNDTINGFDCKFFEVTQGGRRIREMCVAEWGDIEGGEEAADAMIGMGNFFARMHEAFAETAGAEFMGPQQEIFAQMRELGGFPIYAKDYDDAGALEAESSLKSSSSESIDPALFEPPKGYRKQEMSQ